MENGKTGILFENQTVENLSKAIEQFEEMSFDKEEIRNHALKFSEEEFRRQFIEYVEKEYKK